MKTNSNSLHKIEYRTYNSIVQLGESFLKVKKLQVMMNLILIL